MIDEKKALENGTGTAQGFIRSKLTPDKFSQPLLAQKIMRSFLNNYKDKLNKLNQKREYNHNLYRRKEKTGEFEQTLELIIKRGLKDLAVAANALHDLRQELCLIEEHKVLIAIDKVNKLYWSSPYFSKGIRIKTEDVSLLIR